ncbi:MAG TPA: excinuclease ABC subunit UvrA [Elusimicrobia bacterium]|jgi:excinuclease ABC subunit A|nr:excinuclease ABC subunit UvrA [Elusimicrobiota bacterium]
MEKIIIRGAREHNLKNINLEIPRNKLVVITGLSGSGKSSLAFDTIYAEGQRRYVESLSAYARQFLELMEKPDVDLIEGLSPAIAIEQRVPSHNPRSTVGTVTEIYDYLRLLFARIGIPHCPQCGREIKPQSAQQITDEIIKLPEGTKIQILSPLVRGRKGEYRELFERLRKEGFVRVKVDGKVYGLEEEIRLDKFKRHEISLVVDRLTISPEIRERLADSVETALKMSGGLVQVISNELRAKSQELKRAEGERALPSIFFSEHHACINCGISLPEISPRMFSFNSPYGACAGCDGLGAKLEVDADLVVPNKNLSVNEGAIVPWASPITTRRHRWKYSWAGYYAELLSDLSRDYNFSLDTPFKKLDKEIQRTILYGDGNFEGVITNLERRYRETESDFVKEEIYNKYMRTRVCPVCQGGRLKKESLAIKITGRTIVEITRMSISEVLDFFCNLELREKEKIIAKQILKEIISRLNFLINVGLDYLTLNRESYTLAGGEAERIHLATQIGSGLVGVLYILDEPTIGLHQRDNQRLLNTLLKLRDLGNTVIVVEHDEATIRSADWIIDLGPGAGIHGGEVVVSGTLDEILKMENSLTGQYLKRKLKISVPCERRKPKGKYLEILGAQQFNLKNIDVKIPLGLFVCVTGVSGSGKSTLIYEILYKALAQKFYKAKELPGKYRAIHGLEHIDKVILVDQSPIGRTPRSNPATYTGAFTPIRQLFAQLPEAKRRGYLPGRFSFNVKGGRCESCRGDGTIKIEMQFLPAVYIKCDVCQGKRFNEETLQVRYKGKNISDVLEMPVEEALEFFANIPQVKRILQTLYDVGLGYIKLGQSATTLSGGEAQRVKLASELCKRSTGRTVYILDEPTTGLHFADIEKLLNVLQRLVDLENTVIVIEHNLEVIKTCDWIIDLGPEGGEKGGEVIATGKPEEVILTPHSYTGQFLNRVLTP